MVVTTVLYGHGVRWAVIVSWTCQSCWRSLWKMECFDQQVSHQQVVFAWVFVLRTLSAGSIPAGIVLVTFRIPYSDKCPAYLWLLQNALLTLSVACSMAGHMLVRVTQGLHGSRSCHSMYSAETLHA